MVVVSVLALALDPPRAVPVDVLEPLTLAVGAPARHALRRRLPPRVRLVPGDVRSNAHHHNLH